MKINRLSQKIKAYAAVHRQKKKWLMAVTCLAAVVVFCTTYMLALPALTLEADQTLACTYEVHQHNDNCFDEDGNVTCGYADYVVHSHDSEYCYDKDGNLVCPLDEVETHEHSDSCYTEQSVLVCEETESNGHVHDESCYTSVQSELICEITDEDHKHGDDCYAWENVLTCEMEEGDGAHQHSEACYETETVLTCDKDEVILHTHTEDCYKDILDDDGEVIGQTLICGHLQVEEHQHDADCLAVPEKTAEETADPDKDVAELTGEEQTQVDKVIARIEALPSYEEVSNTLAAYDEAKDYERYDEYLTEIQLQVSDVYAAYSALTEKQQAEVTNADKLLELVEAFKLVSTTSEDEEVDNSDAALAYIDAFQISKVIDGSEPFDKSGEISGTSVDEPGNDNGPENRVVRTFDSIEYDMNFTLGIRDTDVTMSSVEIGFELSLYKGATAAEFNTNAMSWLEKGWQIDYLDKDGKVILVKDSTGLYEWDAENGKKGNKTSLNDFVSGSTGNNAYMVNNGIVQQKLTGTYTIEKEEGETLAGAQQGLTAFINVLAATDGETFEPSFKVWVVGNEENLDAGGQASSANEIVVVDSQYAVMVSAAARYNVLVKNSGATNYLGYFDFSTGKQVNSVDDTAAYGRMLSWGITLQLYNETDSEEEGVLVSKGYRGIELPIDGITFDLTLTSSVKSGDSELTTNYKFSPYLWDYHANESEAAGTWGRNLYWGNNERTRYAKSVAPFNNSNTKVTSYGNGTNYCYNGGTWTLTGYTVDGNEKDSKTKTDLSSSSGTGSGTVYRFSVSGYDFDFDDFLSQFPLAAAGDSGTSSLLSAPAYSFSAGHIQVLQRFDEIYNKEFTAYVNAEVSNLKAQSKTNASAKEVKTTDNKAGLSVVKYSPGEYSKYISLTDREANDKAFTGVNKFNYYSKDYFLGGSNLEDRSDDASAYAGSDIYMFSRGYRTSGDGYINAINFLQKFDSKVLSIDTDVTDAKLVSGYGTADPTQPWFAWYVGFATSSANEEGKKPGTATYLYAADPLWPEGYDTNSSEKRSFTKNGVTYNYTAAQRMAFAQEEDLIYFESLDTLKGAKYTCIGVLMEVRNCSLEAGSNTPTLRVAMKVSPDAENIGKTVSTTAVIRNWLDDGGSMSDISWKNGSANDTEVTTGGKTVANTLNKDGAELTDLTKYGTCKALTNGSGPAEDKLYVKSEYDNGNIVTGTHRGGYISGMSMLVIGYKSYLNIGVKNVKDGTVSDGKGNVIFEIDKGEWTGEYTISNIHTEATKAASQSSTTNLKLKVTAQKESKVGDDDGLTMVKSSFKIATTDDEGKTTYTSIGTGEDNKTEFKFTYNGEEYNCSAYIVFDSEDQASIYLKDVPIGATLPDIVFDAEIGSGVGNNAPLTVSAAISGDQDSRAQRAENGNYVEETIQISTLSSSSLVKEVDEVLTELNGQINYTIAYSNTGAQTKIDKMYLYDLRPYNGDIRNSAFDGTAEIKGIEAYLSDAQGNTSGVSFSAYARFYYSTVDPEKLKSILGQKDFDKMPDTEGIYLQALLDNALVDNDGNVYFFLDSSGKICDLYTYANKGLSDERITGAKFKVDSDRYVDSVDAKYSQFVKVSGVSVDAVGNIALTSTNTDFSPKTYKKMFRHYGYIHGALGSTEVKPGQGAEEEFGSATCLFARVTDLSPDRTLNIKITMETENNAAGNIYGNKAHSTIAGNTKSHLSSNTVKTRVVSREISGRVWWDKNHNGAYDDGETLLSGVECALFKQAADKTWVKCTADVTEAAIKPVITDTDGAYSFTGLAEGTYVVAFKNAKDSTALDKFTGATRYQAGKDADAVNSDGQAVTDSQNGLSGYNYFIRYSESNEGVGLSSLKSIANSTAFSKDSYKETYDHLDLGLVTVNLSIDKVSNEGSNLTGAKFLLYRGDSGGAKSYYSYDSGTDTTTWVTDENKAEVLTTGDADSYLPASVHWLTAGTYYLSETSAPDGYYPLTEPVEITVSADGSVTVKYGGETYSASNTAESTSWKVAFEKIAEGDYAWRISVPNSSGYELPETGGAGTTLYTIGGLLLIAGAGTLLLYSKKKRRKEDFASS